MEKTFRKIISRITIIIILIMVVFIYKWKKDKDLNELITESNKNIGKYIDIHNDFFYPYERIEKIQVIDGSAYYVTNKENKIGINSSITIYETDPSIVATFCKGDVIQTEGERFNPKLRTKYNFYINKSKIDRNKNSEFYGKKVIEIIEGNDLYLTADGKFISLSNDGVEETNETVCDFNHKGSRIKGLCERDRILKRKQNSECVQFKVRQRRN